jgi:polysaccharide export outer membrane protein
MRIKTIYLYSVLFFLILGFSSCVSKKKMIYFQGDDLSQDSILNTYAPKIQPDDELSIIISGTDAETVKPYNLVGQGVQASGSRPMTYLVDPNGFIDFPTLGKLYIEGLSTDDLKKKLTTILEPFVSNPIVTIRPTNFRVTVLGEVSSPGIKNLANERVTLAEVIGMAGDLTINGKRKNILLIRSTEGKYERVRLDLTDTSLFSSPYFYLAQNDIIYVEPNRAKVNSSARGTISSYLGLISGLLSLFFVLTR